MTRPLKQLLDSERPEIVSRAKAKAAAMLLKAHTPRRMAEGASRTARINK